MIFESKRFTFTKFVFNKSHPSQHNKDIILLKFHIEYLFIKILKHEIDICHLLISVFLVLIGKLKPVKN